MKPLYRSAVTLTFLTIIGIVISVLFAAMKRLHIESWFFFNPSVIIGFLSGFLLVSIISLGNVHHLRRRVAKGILTDLDGFSSAAESIRNLLVNQTDAIAIPEQLQPELMRALSLLDERTGSILRGERLAFIKGATNRRGKCLCSPLARAEYALYEEFAPVAEHASAAYRTQSMLPYLKDETERSATQDEFMRRLLQLLLALQPESAFEAGLRDYRERVDHFLGARRAAPKDAPHRA